MDVLDELGYASGIVYCGGRKPRARSGRCGIYLGNLQVYLDGRSEWHKQRPDAAYSERLHGGWKVRCYACGREWTLSGGALSANLQAKFREENPGWGSAKILVRPHGLVLSDVGSFRMVTLILGVDVGN